MNPTNVVVHRVGGSGRRSGGECRFCLLVGVESIFRVVIVVVTAAQIGVGHFGHELNIRYRHIAKDRRQWLHVTSQCTNVHLFVQLLYNGNNGVEHRADRFHVLGR